MVFCFPVVLFCCCVVVQLCCCVVLLVRCFADVSMGGPMEIPMPGGRSEVFRDSGGEAGCLSEERTSPRPVGGIGQGRAACAAKEREGGASWAESRCRNGAGADGIRVRTSSFPWSPARRLRGIFAAEADAICPGEELGSTAAYRNPSARFLLGCRYFDVPVRFPNGRLKSALPEALHPRNRRQPVPHRRQPLP